MSAEVALASAIFVMPLVFNVLNRHKPWALHLSRHFTDAEPSSPPISKQRWVVLCLLQSFFHLRSVVLWQDTGECDTKVTACFSCFVFISYWKVLNTNLTSYNVMVYIDTDILNVGKLQCTSPLFGARDTHSVFTATAESSDMIFSGDFPSTASITFLPSSK